MGSKLLESFNYPSLIVAALTIYLAQYYYKHFTRLNPLPGPFPFPFVGNLPQLYFSHGGNLKNFFEYNYKKYGDMFEVQFESRIIVLCRTEYIEKLLSASTRNQHISNFFDDLGISNQGILLNQEPKSWRYNRHFFSLAILSPKFVNEAIHWTNKLFNELESYWDKLYIKEGTNKENKKLTADISIWFNQFTNDIIIALITGERSYTMAGYFNSISNDEKDKRSSAIIDETVNLVDAIRKYLLNFVAFQFIPSFLRFIPFFKKRADNLFESKEFINQRIEAIIKRRRQEIENTPLDKPLPGDMLTSVMIANTVRDTEVVVSEDERPMTDIEIRTLVFDGIIAGTDTTANMISYIIYYLAHNPYVKKKMLDEIDRVFQGDKTRPVTKNDLNNLRYCEAIVREVSRVFPVVSSLSRYLNQPDEIAGYRWPADTTIRVNIDAIQNKGDYWEDPKKFNPDRWMAEDFEPKKNSFIMFGGGLRMCPGRKLAMIELVSLTVLIFRKYEIDLVDMEAPIKIDVESILINACAELLVEIKLRN